MNILITGGAGYKGTLLTESLLKDNHKVTVFDNFMFETSPMLAFAHHPSCMIIKGDVRNLDKELKLSDYDIIYHLAAITGFPACEANPHSARSINVLATENLVKNLSPQQILVYASTTSLYGNSDKKIDENSAPAPASLYAQTKLQAEQICLERKNSLAFRFATLFGASYKMRTDLLIHDFINRAIRERVVVLFESNSVRTFLHVRDAVQAYTMVPKLSAKMMGQIFNVGSNQMNYSKLQLARAIKEHLPDLEIIESSLADLDKRNFTIKFEKLSALGFKPTIPLQDGIKELVKLYKWYAPYLAYKTI